MVKHVRSIGITGGVACGKSAVTDYLAELNYPIIDADEIVHALYRKKSVKDEIKNHFQTCDKKELREIIFTKPQARQILEDILHPLVQKEIKKQLNKYKRSKEALAFVSIPLLFESNMQDMFDQTLAITCKEETQIKRLMKRDEISEKQALDIIHAQMPNIEKEKLADTTITNNSSQGKLKKQVDKLLTKLKASGKD